MNKFWKIVIPLICLLVVIATAVVIVYLYWPAIKGTLDGSKYYTEEDIKASYNKGYDEASKLLNELQEQVNYYKKQIDDYNKQLYSLIPEVDRLREDKKINLEKISFLEKQVKKFEEQIISFNETIEDLNKQLKFFQNNSESSIIELQNLRFEKQNLQNQCDNYIIRINELNDTLNYYKELINSNVNDNECTISFCVDDFIYDTIIVNKNSTFNIPNIPTKNNYKFGYDNEEIFTFKGWSIDGQNVIDLSEYVVNENTTFYALFDTTFKYDLICVNNTISDYTIEIENTKSTINEFEITLNSFKTLFVYDNIDYLKVRNIVTSLYNSFYSKFSVSSGHYWTWDTYIYDYDYYLFLIRFTIMSVQ